MARWIFTLLAAGAIIAALSGCPPPPAPPAPTPVPVPTPTPAPTPTPPPYVPAKRLEVGKIFNGLQYRASFETEIGTTATEERDDPASYAVEVKVKVKVPKPHRDVASLSRLNADLPTVLPELPKLLETAKVSPVFDELYRLKTASVQKNLLRLDALLTRHNYYDCETMLELQHPASKRRALLLQGDMDTCTDGSDADRVPEVDGSSVTFQPFTSYRWPKKGTQPSSFIPPREAKLRQYAQELVGATPARQQEIKEAQAQLKMEIADLKKHSYLVAAVDPYVVMPGALFAARGRSAFSPALGDLCVVIYEKKLYPAVVGDVGPMNLIGESSLRICREINARASANNRPVSDLKATYLFFPGTAEKPFDVPNLVQWRTRCEALLKEIGGYGGDLHVWEEPKPKATPVPATPAPAATPAPKATPTPTAG